MRGLKQNQQRYTKRSNCNLTNLAGHVVWKVVSTKIALGMNKDDQSFRNLSLSFRGAERQAPSVLQIALRFSKILERQAATLSGNTEARLRRVVAQFNASPGLHVKHQLDADKERTVLNLIVGTSKDCG